MNNTSKMRLLLATLGVVAISAQSMSVFADTLIFSNEDVPYNANSIILDYDDTGGDVSIQFGNTLNEQLYWDSANSRFVFTDDLYIQGNLDVTGDISSSGYVDFSNATGLRIREDADPASNAACAHVGELIFDTTDNDVQYCTASGAAGVATWSDVSSGGDGHLQNTDSGTDENAFTLDNDDTGGNVQLVFGTTVGEYLRHDGTLFHFSDDLQMDGDKGVQFRDADLSINSSVDGQLDIDADVELEIDAPTVDFTGADITNVNIDADATGVNVTNIDNTNIKANAGIEFSKLATRVKKYFIKMRDLTVLSDGTNNTASVYAGSESGSNPHQYYIVTSRQTSLNDLDIKVKVKLPEDFVSFANTGDLSFYYKNTGTNDTDSKLDILVEDDDGDSAFNPADGQGLFNTSWTEYADEFDGANFDPSAGDYIYVTIRGYASKAGATYQDAYAGELVLSYTGR